MLTLLGAPALMALRDRSPAQLVLIDGRVLVASGGCAVPVAAYSPGAASGKLPHFIFEYTAGRDVAGADHAGSAESVGRPRAAYGDGPARHTHPDSRLGHDRSNCR